MLWWLFPAKVVMRIFDVPLLLKRQFFEITTWLKALTDFSVETMSAEPKYSRSHQRIGFSVSCPLPTTIFTCPACCFEWHASRRRKASGVLGSPIGVITGTRASPTRIDTTSQNSMGLFKFQCTYKRGNGRLHLHGETCHHFALFLLSTPRQ